MEVLPGALSQRATLSPPAPEKGIDGAALVTAVAIYRDQAAFARLFAFYAPRVRGHLLARGAAPPIADELTQEVMLTVWLKAGQFDVDRGQVSTWLYAITRNCFFNHRDRQRWPAPDAAEIATPSVAAEQLLLSAESHARVREAVGSLPAEQRETLAAAYFRGRTLREVADNEGIPLGTVKTRVRLAMARLRHLLTGKSANDDV